MRYGFVLPGGDARVAADMAAEAEAAGWDGFFVWEAVWGADPWVALAAAAMRTSRIRLGTLLTPLPWRQPWKLAAETATLDHLSGGRLILSIGLGAPEADATPFGVVTDRRVRAELMDEGLAILKGLWAGQPFSFTGKHYQIVPAERIAPPAPVQRPHPPIWAVGAWGSPASMRRALACDGILPTARGADGQWNVLTEADMRALAAHIAAERDPATPYDIITEGTTPADDRAAAAAIVRPWAEAGATWWIESMWTTPDLDAVRARLVAGPPGE